MKLVIAVVQDADADAVVDALVGQGYRATRIASTGGFLKAGNSTLMIGAGEDEVAAVIDVIREHCRTRVETVNTKPRVEYEVGGAVIFVTPIDQFERV